MANFDSYGKRPADFQEHKVGKLPAFNDKQGGDVDPFGDVEKKEADALDMNAGETFNKSDFTKVDAMGTDYPTGSTKGQKTDNTGDHFSVGDVDPSGDDCGKDGSGQSSKRG